MTNYGFQKQKFPLKHEFVIEQCSALNVGEVLGHLPLHNDKNFIPWNLPNNSGLRVVPARTGISVRWYFVCLGCQRRCESLYVPPGRNPLDWRCRICHDLIFASQRFSCRHALRKKMNYRQKVRLRKEMMREATNKRPRKNPRKPWQNPKILVQAEKIQPQLDGITGESFEVILNLAKNSQNQRVQNRAKRLIKKYLAELKKMSKESEAAKIVVIQ